MNEIVSARTMASPRQTIRNKAACGTCAYWQIVAERSRDGYQDEGICRRRAPSAVPSADVCDQGEDAGGGRGLSAAWPRTFAEDDWCGEYRVFTVLGGRERVASAGAK
jgi:hypothetical protein